MLSEIVAKACNEIITAGQRRGCYETIRNKHVSIEIIQRYRNVCLGKYLDMILVAWLPSPRPLRVGSSPIDVTPQLFTSAICFCNVF